MLEEADHAKVYKKAEKILSAKRKISWNWFLWSFLNRGFCGSFRSDMDFSVSGVSCAIGPEQLLYYGGNLCGVRIYAICGDISGTCLCFCLLRRI